MKEVFASPNPLATSVFSSTSNFTDCTGGSKVTLASPLGVEENEETE